MTKVILSLLLVASIPQISFSQGETKEFNTDWNSLTKDYMTWYEYTYDNIRLSQNFIGLDIDSSKIEKTAFINKLMQGDRVAFNTEILNGQPVYRLFKLDSKDESIKAVITQMAATELRHLKMEGKAFPGYSFTDLNGKTYDNASSKGKLTLVKFWFIHCGACIAEFPVLNKLVNQYKNNPDIQFISLALDNKDELVKFLKKKRFSYPVVPEMKNYIGNNFTVTGYPTHILLDKNGIIVKVVHRIEDLIPFLEAEISTTR